MGRGNLDNGFKEWKAEKLAQVMYFMIAGKTQKESARLADITPKTVCAWFKLQPELKEMVRKVREKAIANPLKAGVHFPVIKAYTRVKMPDKYSTLEKIEKHFNNDLKRL